jgi:urease accessory protein
VRSQRLVLPLVALPGPAAAHDAFGDLGPFYQAFLHPLADPAQGLLLAATALLLARQPLAIVRPAYAALAAGGLSALVIGTSITLPAPGLRTMTVVALLLALAALLNPRPGAVTASVLAAALGSLAAISFDPVSGTRTALLTVLGGAVGIALVTLFIWGVADWADRRVSPFATSVAAAWVGAIALMAAVLPV